MIGTGGSTISIYILFCLEKILIYTTIKSIQNVECFYMSLTTSKQLLVIPRTN
jgi:hypothetical protein